MTQTVNKTHAHAMLLVVVLVSAFVLYFDQRLTSILQMSAALMLTGAVVTYAHTQHRTGAFRLPLAIFAASAVLYFSGYFCGMTALLFNHLGREVLTTSWSVAENDDATVNLWYAWGQGNSLMTLPVSMPVLRSRITESPTICDLRHLT